MRSSLLDIQLTPNNRPTPSTTVIRMHIQPRNHFRRSQHHRQLQFCVPLVMAARPSYLQAPNEWVKGNRAARIPGSIDGNEFDARFDEAVQQIYNSGDTRPIAFSHGAAIMYWTQMNVDNPAPALLSEAPLQNTGRVVVTGSPGLGWKLVTWQAKGP